MQQSRGGLEERQAEQANMLEGKAEIAKAGKALEGYRQAKH
jgi:hypothetical protein